MADDIRRDDYRGSVLLNLLAGFESINLGSLLEHTFEGGGGGGRAMLQWFWSLILDKSQKVILGNHCSSLGLLVYGMPSG